MQKARKNTQKCIHFDLFAGLLLRTLGVIVGVIVSAGGGGL